MINIIVAIDKNKGIGKNNKLPWYLPNDLKYFKELTLNNVVIMGRKTFVSIGKPLPKRDNIILTNNKDFRFYETQGDYSTLTAHGLDELKNSIDEDEDVFVIGGAQIIKLFIEKADKIYLTYIDEVFDCDTFLDCFNEEDWILESEFKGEKDEKNPYDYYFRTYVRNTNNEREYVQNPYGTI